MTQNLKKPVMAWPFRIGGFNSSEMQYIEQDEAEEIAQCVTFIFASQPGQLIDDPELGLARPIFRDGGIPVIELEETARNFEPRSRLTITQNTLIALAQTVDINVEGGATE